MSAAPVAHGRHEKNKLPRNESSYSISTKRWNSGPIPSSPSKTGGSGQSAELGGIASKSRAKDIEKVSFLELNAKFQLAEEKFRQSANFPFLVILTNKSYEQSFLEYLDLVSTVPSSRAPFDNIPKGERTIVNKTIHELQLLCRLVFFPPEVRHRSNWNLPLKIW
jgi:hypothetical protein